MKLITPQKPLLDVTAINKEQANTFKVPPENIINAIKPGDTVQLICANERILCRIKNKDEWFVGEIDNRLVGTPLHGLSFGDRIQFSKNNILKVFPGFSPLKPTIQRVDN